MHVNEKKNRVNQLFLMVGICFCIILSLTCQNALVIVDNGEYKGDSNSENEIDEILQLSAESSWNISGNVISEASANQEDPELCSDGQGGAIFTWVDNRNGNFDIYAQRINSDGTPQWTIDGVAICTENYDQETPQLCSDGQGGAIITWSDYRSNSKNEIYAQRINSSGIVQWTANGTEICTATLNQITPQICSDGQGGAIITWRSTTPQGNVSAQRIDYKGTVLWDADGITICGADMSQITPQICSDGQGGAIITWADYRNGNYDIYAQRINSSGIVEWTDDGVEICTDSDQQEDPRLCSDGQGGAIITWRDDRGTSDYDIYAQLILSNGTVSWETDGEAICTSQASQLNPQLCSDGQGGAIITWQDLRMGAGNHNIYAQRILSNGSVLWTGNGTAICTYSGEQTIPQICSDNQGGAIITWRDDRGDGNDIFAQRVLFNESVLWTINGTTICSASEDQERPRICSDGVGGAIITWKDERMGSDQDDIYAGRINSDGVIPDEGEPWKNNGNAICIASGVQSLTQMCSDGQGGAIITWKDQRTDSGDIYAQRIDSDGAVSWTADGVAICTESYEQSNPQLCTDGQGGAIITWEDERGNVDRDIYAQRIDFNGNIIWIVDGVVISDEIEHQEDAQIISDAQGGAIITWEDYRDDAGAQSQIYGQRILSNGTVSWTDDGEVICDAINNQLNPQIVSDGAGGAIITWEDNRNFGTTETNLYAQQILYNGSILWTEDGMVICDTDSDQQNPQLCSDGAGGAFITWEDFRNGYPLIYAQRILPNGSIALSDNGDVITTASDNQWDPQLCSDGQGGAIIVWEDERSDSGDIYAQRIDSSGIILWAPSGNGEVICNAINVQDSPQLCSDGQGGAIITWQDNRNGNNDIYSQRISYNGTLLWVSNGAIISTETSNQIEPQICSDGQGGAIIAWEDERSDSGDIYAQRIKSSGSITLYIPTVINPGPISTVAGGSETIDWILLDGHGTGLYQVLANDTNGGFYVWQDWQSWDNNSALNVPINRSAPGIFNYTIEYNNSDSQFGIPDTVIVTISDSNPTAINPGSISTSGSGSETIDWVLLDDFGTGLYRVLANDTNGAFYVWRDWQSWDNNSALNVPINRTLPGIFNYTIEYNDSLDQLGIPNTVIVTISESIPISNNPGPVTTSSGDTESINITLYDDFGGGHYRVLVNDTNDNYYVWQGWMPWISGQALSISINRSALGVFNYTIEYNNSLNQFGTPLTIIVTISSDTPGGGPFNWLTPEMILLLIGILIAVIGSITGAFLVRKKRHSRSSYPSISQEALVSEVPQKIESLTDKISEEIKEKTSKIGQILGFMLDVGEAITKGDLVKAFHFTLDEADDYLKTLDSSVSYKKSEISEIKKKAEEALQQYTQPTLYDLVVTLGFDHVMAMKVGKYLTKTGVISKFNKIQPKETGVQPELKPTPLEKMALEIKRGGDWAIEGNQSIFKYKVKVHNSSEFIFTNIQILLTSIPRSLEVDSELYKIEHLRPHAYESPTFNLKAQESCVGDVIEGVVSYIDSHGKQHTETIEPLVIEYVCNLLNPKQVTETEYKRKTESMDKREITIDSDLAPDELEKELASILENNNFFLLDKAPESADSKIREIKGYAEGKYDKEDVGLSVVMQEMPDQNTNLIIKAMSDREEKLIDLLRDINVKCDDIKSCNELILEYSMKIEQVIDQIDNLEDFLVRHLGKDFEQIKHVWTKFKTGQIGKKGLIAEGAKILGKRFLKLFIGRIS